MIAALPAAAAVLAAMVATGCTRTVAVRRDAPSALQRHVGRSVLVEQARDAAPHAPPAPIEGELDRVAADAMTIRMPGGASATIPLASIAEVSAIERGGRPIALGLGYGALVGLALAVVLVAVDDPGPYGPSAGAIVFGATAAGGLIGLGFGALFGAPVVYRLEP